MFRSLKREHKLIHICDRGAKQKKGLGAGGL